MAALGSTMRRFPVLVKFKAGSTRAGVVALMTGPSAGYILAIPDSDEEPFVNLNLLDLISITVADVEVYGGAVTISNNGASAS